MVAKLIEAVPMWQENIYPPRPPLYFLHFLPSLPSFTSFLTWVHMQLHMHLHVQAERGGVVQDFSERNLEEKKTATGLRRLPSEKREQTPERGFIWTMASAKAGAEGLPYEISVSQKNLSVTRLPGPLGSP
jgi:hypothetical protein